MAIKNQVAEHINRSIRRFVQVQQFSKGQANDFKLEIARIEQFIRNELSKHGNSIATVTELNRSLSKINKFTKKTLDRHENGLVKNLLAMGSMEASFERDVLLDEVKAGVKVSKLDKKQVKRAIFNKPINGQFVGEVLSQFNTSQIRAIDSTLRNGYYNGLTVQNMITQLRGTKRLNFKDGVLLGKSERQAEAMVRTLSNHSYNSVRDELFKANSDIVKGEEFIATLDDNTTLICASNDGKVFAPDDNKPVPPLHYGCRSILVPVIFPASAKPSDAKTTRSSKGSAGAAPVDSGLRFNDWLGQQSSDFQDSYLGKTKGELFREGGLKINSFVDSFGDPYTLSDLQKLQPEAFKKANIDASNA